MFPPKNITTIDDFKRSTSRHLARMKRTGEPQLLTLHGKPAVVVIDAEVYQGLLDMEDRETFAGLTKAIAELDRDEGIPAKAVFDELLRRRPTAPKVSA